MRFGIGTSSRGAVGRRRWGRRLIVPALALALLVPVGEAPSAVAKEQGLGQPELPKPRVSKVAEVKAPGAKKARQKVAEGKRRGEAQSRRAATEQKTSWPGRGTATARLVQGAPRKLSLDGTTVTVTPRKVKRERDAAGEARVTVLDQKAARRAGVTGVLLTATAETAGSAKISVDYGDFASAIGGGWAQRLRLVELPACALTTPEKAACRKQAPLESENDPGDQSVTAQVAVSEQASGAVAQKSAGAPTVLALTAQAAGAGESPKGSGDYSATELSASSSWTAGGSSGSFTWNYDFSLPPAAAGPVPSLALSYDSGSVDGRTATTNNQGSAVGEGFSLTESYIERSYGSCDDDGHDDVFDRCWKYDNARIVLDGRSSRLIKVSDKEWRLEDDDASTVTRSTGADNGDNDGEYWTVVTGNGTKYLFGLNKLDGAADQRTNSTWTVPVFGDDSGEPGYDKGGAFADRSLTQAWRWNLDQVEDTAGNASTYWYAKESNHYKKNKAETATASYTRGGYLKEIKYGLRKDALFTDDADAKVTFSHAERCTVGDCKELTESTAKHWPDVPFDAICSDGDKECNSAGASFFSRKRLTGVETYSWDATTKKYSPVDSWTLGQDYKDAGDIGDTTDHVLVLESIKRTGKAGTDVGVNPVTFTYQLRPNRVDATDDILPLKRHRVETITSETGAITTVTLSSPECKRSEVLGAPQDTNTRSCYPQYWNINGASEASVDWFHKYRVLAVAVADPTGHNEDVEHAYDYAGAAWHHLDEPFTPKDERTWSDWRGYRDVTVYSGATQTTRSKTVSRYLQGMDGDRKKDGTKTASVEPLLDTDVDFGSVADADRYRGLLRQQVTYNGSQPISSTFNSYAHKTTATQTVPGADDHTARWVRPATTYSSTYLTASKNWRTRQTTNTHDDLGMVTTVDDYGQRGVAGDETCTRTWYARNDAVGINNLVSRSRTVAKECAVSDTALDLPGDSTRRGDVLTDTAIAYDGATTWSATAKPAKGLITWTGRAKGYTGGTPSWQTQTTTANADYDALGRATKITNADGKTTTTEYTPAAAGPLTKSIVTDPKGHKTTSFLDPRRGQPLRTYDANLKKTESTYDGLGRLTQVWLPNRSSGSQSPNQKYAYHLSNTKQSWVSSSSLKKDGESYLTSYAIYDALLRPLQTQTESARGGRLLTDTRYDTRGLAYETYADIFDTTSSPNGTYTRAEYGEAPTQTETVYDGAGRAVSNTVLIYGNKKWTVGTSYTGDSTATTAVQGGTGARVITDVRGRTTESREYAGRSPSDAQYGDGPGAGYASTKYVHTPDGKNSQITGPDDAKWSYGYDLFGRLITSKDPDKGSVTTQYDALDRAVKTTDSRGKSVLTEYDELSRVTGTWAGSRTDATQLTAYTYDTLLKGLPVAATRYVGGKPGQAYTDTVTAYDTLSRPKTTKLDLPAGDAFVKAGVPASLTYETEYNLDGTVKTVKEPALGGLPSEVLEYGYNSVGQVTSLGGSTGYLLDTTHTPLGQPQLLTLGTANTADHKKVYLSNSWEEGTGRLVRSSVTDQTHSYMLQDLNYAYDDAGNVTSITDPTTVGGTSSAETQCFVYDGHRRLTEAWTPSSQKCGDARSADQLSGPAPYWTSYEYNKAGQRTSETAHAPAAETTTNYCYTKNDQPHFLTGTTTKGSCATPEKTYTPDSAGNTAKRPGAAGTQGLTWSEEGRLTKLTEGSKSTDYLYDAAGELLIRATQGADRVLYAGATELHLRADGTTWAQRSYTAEDRTVAVRSNEGETNKLTYLTGDHHGTQSVAIGADATQTVNKRHLTPFGAERGKPTNGAWPDDKGFLGKTNDKTTGLTHIGARQYDPAIGQFISVDPILDLTQPQSLNGYSYASNTPLTLWDPTGLNGGGNPGNPGNSGSKMPYGGELGDWEDVPSSAGKPLPTFSSVHVSGKSSGIEPITNVGYGESPLPPPDVYQQWQEFLPSVVQMRNLGTYVAQLGYALNVELFFREHCSVSPSGDACQSLRDFYATGKGADRTNWGHVQGLPGVNKCDICQNIGFDLLMAGIPAGRGKGSTPQCFLAGTDVVMADGSTKDIEDIEVGDLVLSTDPETGKTGAKKVTKLSQTVGEKHLNELSIATEDGAEQLTATDEHPFWSPSEKSWIAAGDLTSGMSLLTSDGQTVIVTGNRGYTSYAATYNFTVEDWHTYYVLAGKTPVLVHNANCIVGTRQFDHAWDEHSPGGSYHKAGKVENVFADGIDKARFRGMVDEAIKNGTHVPRSKSDPRGGYYIDYDFGDVEVGAMGQNGMRIAVDDAGNFVTAMPKFMY